MDPKSDTLLPFVLFPIWSGLTLAERVQLGVALSAAEKLQAIPGPWSSWIAELLKKYVYEEGTLADAVTWDTRRAKPFQHVLSMSVLCYDPSRISKPPTSTELAKWLGRSDGVSVTSASGFVALSDSYSPTLDSGRRSRWLCRSS